MRRIAALTAVTIGLVVVLVSAPRSPQEDPPPAVPVTLTVYPATQRAEPGAFEILTPITGRRLYQHPELILDNTHVADATVTSVEGRPAIHVRLTDPGARVLQRATEDWLGDYLVIYLDSTRVAAPKVMAVLDEGRLLITGSLPPGDAWDLARGITAP